MLIQGSSLSSLLNLLPKKGMIKMYFTDNGEYKPSNVFIVWGSPGAGKSTYIKEHYEYGDIVVDLDYIKRAISFLPKSESTNAISSVSIKIRDFLYDLISNESIECKNIWVVSALPIKAKRIALSNRLGAKLIHIDTDKEECLKRAMSDNDRQNKDFQKIIIDKYWKRYRPD